MRKIVTQTVAAMAALAMAAAVVTGSATAASADTGSAVAAGILGGAVGVMVGAAAARSAQPPVEVYERAEPVYIEEAPPPPECHMERQRVYDEDGEPAGSRPVRVCD